MPLREETGTPSTIDDADALAEVLALGRGEPLPVTDRRAVHELVADVAHARPDRIAVRGGGRDISYGALEAWARRIAVRLAEFGVDNEARVGLLAGPGIGMIAAVLGVLKSGAAYVPIEPSRPEKSRAQVFRDARVTCVVVTGDVDNPQCGLDVPLIRVAEDEPSCTLAGQEQEVSLPAVTGDDPAYLIYTSGTTGEPKGVVVEHSQLSASTCARQAVYRGAPTFLLVSPLSFDSSVAGVWGTLTTGGCLVVASSDEARDPRSLVELIARHEVTRLLCVPSLYGVLLDAAERAGEDRLRTLETVIVAGESLPESLVRRHFAMSSAATLVNEYGPTEAGVWASYHRFEEPDRVCIGGPIPGARLYVLDDRLRPLPRGTSGELFIGGAGVARGYFGAPDATADAFLADPFAGKAEARMYRTGDLVRWNERGTLEFLGRRDHQIKIRGKRVELTAIETKLHEIPGVRDAAVVPNEEHTLLTGFVLASSSVSEEAVRGRLRDELAPPMVPTRIRVVDRLPRTPNGKVDRTALRAMADAEPAAGERNATDDNDMASKVASAWAEVLKQSTVPTDVNFFDLGGHSLAMFKLQEALERHTGTRPSVVTLFRHTTVSAQAVLIAGGADEAPARGGSAESSRRAQAIHARRRRVAKGAEK